MATIQDEEKKIKVVAVVGPTGCGKSQFAIELAHKIDGEIISCDSMAVYKGVEIATDKIPEQQREGIPHHLYDVKEAGTFFSAGLFKKLALKTIDEIAKRNKVPILVGGTGLYFRTLTEGIADAPQRDESIRKRLKKIVEKKGVAHLFRILKRVDPKRAFEINENDGVRIVRSLELRFITKLPFDESIKKKETKEKRLEILKICLNYPREILYKRIDERVENMVKRGLVEEAKNLYHNGRLKGPISKAIGLKELIPYFEGNRDLSESIEEIKKNSRNLAKRQITWFKREIGLKWILMTDEEEKNKIVEKTVRWLKGEKDDKRS
jgi:tRNA dimethylallyltransferase